MPKPVIIVTGASRGIGRAIAEELQRRGATIVGAARNIEGLTSTDTFSFVSADISEDAGRHALIAATLERHGRIDGLINNAGQVYRAPAIDIVLDELRKHLDVNLLSALALSQLAYPHLKASRGTIVNISSVTSHVVLQPRLAYSIGKAALDHMTRCLAVEWGPDGIRVNAVLPWFTRTEMIERLMEDPTFEEKMIAQAPLRRLGEPAEIARAVAFLALPESDFITGQLLAVDGGYLAQG